MPIIPVEASETEGAFEVVHRTLSSRALASAFSLPSLAKADPQRLSIAMPHRVEFPDLSDMRRDTIPKKKEADCWRFLVLEEREPIAAATALRAEAEGFEFGGLNEGPFVKGTEDAILQAEALAEIREGQFEAVLLVVPGLYVVALWLQDLGSKAAKAHSSESDLLIALPPSNPALDAGEPMPPASFLEALRRAP